MRGILTLAPFIWLEKVDFALKDVALVSEECEPLHENAF